MVTSPVGKSIYGKQKQFVKLYISLSGQISFDETYSTTFAITNKHRQDGTFSN